MVVCEVFFPPSFGSLALRTPFTVFTRSDAFYRRYFTPLTSAQCPHLSLLQPVTYSLVVIPHEDYKI